MKYYFSKRLFQYASIRSAAWSFFLLTPAVTIILTPFQLSAQEEQPTMAPLSPAFIAYTAARSRVKAVPAAPTEHAMGDLPSPNDISHMTGQHPAPAPGTHQVQLEGYAASYDLRSLGKVTSVKDQGSCGACWTFATMASLESKILTDDSWDFSENNLDDTAGFDIAPCGGGTTDMSVAYLARWSGPWTETADPYTVTTNKQSPTYPSPNAQKHVQEVLLLPDRGSSTDNDNIKWALTTHGALKTSIYMNTAYYRSAYKSYYYSGTSGTNHAVTIVGWDDNFAASKFTTTPPGNGAFIVKNSWGTGWGESGYFYVSYYDANLKNNAVFIGAESNSNYYRVYQHDPLGNTGGTGYGSGTGWFANFFTAADANTQVDAVSFYTRALNSSYTVYVYLNSAAGSPRSGTLMSSQSGSFAYAGYHTVPLTTKVPLTNGQTFTVVVQMTTPGYNFPIPIEGPVANYSSGATASLGQSYISSAGTTWTDLNATTPNRNVCLKAFTSKTNDATVPSNVTTVYDGTTPGVDINAVTSLTELSANWTAASDGESGIRRYWYAIGTTPGGTNVRNWTDAGNVTAVTRTGLTLAGGQTYYFSVKAENWVGLQSGITSSNGQAGDSTPPTAPGAVYDSLGGDITYVNSATQLAANWTASSDPESGISKYYYAIGTSAGGTNILGWTDNGTATSVTRNGLSLTNGQIYYFAVKAENGAGLPSGVTNSNGQRVDTTAPTSPGTVNDGTGADITYANSTTQLSANWGTSSDSESGVARYYYAIGTSPGATNVVGWTDNGTATSITRAGLSLTNGQIYYFTVKAENGAGLPSGVANSNGQTVDTTAPSAPGTVNDGTGADVVYTSDRLSANWTASSDAQSGITRYYYAIGTTAGGTNVKTWANNGTATSVTETSLSLTNGQIYYFTVKAENGVGLPSGVTNSNGQTVDNTAPSAPGAVYDGAGIGTDIAYSSSSSQLSANWTASTDAQSGIAKYYYAIGTTAGATNTVGWTNNGTATSVTKTGLSLTSGQIYYFTVKAENGAGTPSSVLNSNGQTVDTTAPTSPAPVNDGTGADTTYVNSTTQLSANWTASTDAQSGIAKYWYAIGTTAGDRNILSWTNNGTATSVTRTGLSLTNGQIYHFTVMAENGAGLQTAAANSNGQTVDTTAPSAPGTVYDGTGADITYSSSPSQLSANWTAASDAQSGIARYGYAIGTTPGGGDVLGLTDNGNNTSVTKTGLTLTNGQIYYFTVGAENGVGLPSVPTISNGQTVDTTPPSAPGAVYDSTGADITYTNSASQLSANWTAASDAQSGIAKYWYAIGTTAGGTNVLTWTDNGTNISVTKTGLSLTSGQIYYFTIKAQNGAGGQSSALNSNGQRVDTTAPTSPGPVNDGSDTDITYVNSSAQLSANWAAASDAESGLVRYLYAIGTTAGGTNIAGWTDTGTNTSATKSGLSLTNGQIYYFTVKAENGAGLQTTPVNSNGQLVDISAPSAPGAVNDGTGTDIAYSSYSSQLSANWTAASDTQSGVARYYYAIGTTPGATDITAWTDNSANTSVTRTGLGLTSGQTYYFTVVAENGVGMQSVATTSNGQIVDTSPPSAPGAVYDGTGADITYTISSSQLSANWTTASDAQSGIAKYYYAIGTTPGTTGILPWTDNGTNTSVTKTGLSLASGTTYYFTVKAQNGAGTQSSALNSNGQMVDTSSPSSPAPVNDGTGADISYSSSSSQLSANWTAASDAESGLVRYLYAIGTSAGTTNVVGWMDNGINTSITKTGLSLSETTYYFTVKVENGAGLQTTPVNSNGQLVDISPPSAPGAVNDGTGTDIAYSSYSSQLSANWTAASDAQSGIAKYWYAIGTTPGATDITTWTDNSANTSVTRTGLGLTSGTTYYFTVKAQNGAGAQSSALNSDGQLVDTSSPSAPGAVYDGTGADITYTISSSQLSANWTASSDAQSGIAKYWYAIGTSAGATGVTPWTDNGTNTSVTKTGLSLASGTTYYFTVKAQNGAGLQSPTISSTGQTVDTSPPGAIASVNDGIGADVSETGATNQLSANWTASSDAQSGIAKYWYAIGTSAGDTDIVIWTDNGANTSVTKNNLSLVDGVTYYFTVKAENGVGIQASATNSNGQFVHVDDTPPTDVPQVRDGTGADSAWTGAQSQLSANWDASSDAQSDIAKYWYAIGTTAGGREVAEWTDNGTGTSVTRSGLSLADGQTYYFTLKAENGAGLQSGVTNSDGQTVDISSSSIIGAVNDGAGVDIAYSSASSQLSANWTASTDLQSGLLRYLYAIGTSAGATNVVGWLDNGINTSTTTTGLNLTDGQTYYFTLKAENGAGLKSDITNSNGQLVDTSSPSITGAVNDGIGTDAAYAISSSQLSANWTTSSDPHSGIARYWYAIGTTAGGTSLTGWTDNGTNTSTTTTGLGLTDGQTYYFTLKAENGAGLKSDIINSNGQLVDTSSPSITGAVNDGTGEDAAYVNSSSQLSANWTASSDPHSGIARYWYAIGTAAGGTSLTGWTDNGAGTFVTKAGLSLTDGVTYYFTVKVENGAGLYTTPVNSNGQMVDTSSPSAPGLINDGTGSDISYINSSSQLSANWTASSDPHSGIARYWYAIGATAGATNIVPWTDNGTGTSVTKAGLSLTDGVTYYFTVKAENGMGLQSPPVNSNGQTSDTSTPSNPGSVNDGTGADIAWSASLTQLSANWTTSSDPHSGIARYWYAIGTFAGGTDFIAWTDNGTGTSFTQTGLTLVDDNEYYVTVKAENGAGLQSGATNSNGQTIDPSAPSTTGAVNDGTGA
ncbi:MAG: hypothetical protein A2270_09010, partial [Elusimicrobia bacterium RIFOXYA12_FULL_51_18]